jgi:uncharacterized protein YicC (UPF0701 family)
MFLWGFSFSEHLPQDCSSTSFPDSLFALFGNVLLESQSHTSLAPLCVALVQRAVHEVGGSLFVSSSDAVQTDTTAELQGILGKADFASPLFANAIELLCARLIVQIDECVQKVEQQNMVAFYLICVKSDDDTELDVLLSHIEAAWHLLGSPIQMIARLWWTVEVGWYERLSFH